MMRRNRINKQHNTRFLATSLLLVAVACPDCDDTTNPVGLMPKLPAPPDVTVSSTLSIPIEVNAIVVGHIDAKLLTEKKPNYAHDEHRAWRILDLLDPALRRDEHVITVVATDGVELVVPRPSGTDTLDAVFLLTRRGGLVAGLISPEQPFPSFHGQGRRLQRGGDPKPRIGNIAKIKVRTERNAGQKEINADAKDNATLQILLDGQKAGEWSLERLNKTQVPKRSIRSHGTSAHEGWSLRDLVAHYYGQHALVVALLGQQSRRLVIAEKDWANSEVHPMLFVNRQGQFRFAWDSAKGSAADDLGDLRNVQAIEIKDVQ